MKKCSIEGCGSNARKLGWCEFHYDRNRRTGDPLGGGPRRLSPNSLGACQIVGCGKKAIAVHLCVAHYAKLKKFGNPLGGTIQDGRSKEWHPNKDGYVFRFDPGSPHAGGNKLVYRHRFVMGELLGRPLRANESVHHKNGKRSDNRPQNLELWVKSQPAGQRVQDLVKWAREILQEYEKLAV